MKKVIYKYWSKFLTAFGNIKIFKYPCWLVYDPHPYQITGEKTLEIIETLKPGDILLRGYNNYLDGKFVPSKTGWSHGGIYVGNNIVIHAVASGVSEINIIDFVQCDRIAIFRPSKYAKSAIKKAKSFLKD
jgi:cell wall-associated NlpC family hydrolase